MSANKQGIRNIKESMEFVFDALPFRAKCTRWNKSSRLGQ